METREEQELQMLFSDMAYSIEKCLGNYHVSPEEINEVALNKVRKQLQLHPQIAPLEYLEYLKKRLAKTEMQSIFALGHGLNKSNDGGFISVLNGLLYEYRQKDCSRMRTHEDVVSNRPKMDRLERIRQFTEREKKYYGKAIELKYAKQIENGYEWMFEPKRASLAYFLLKVFNPKGNRDMPCKLLENLWRVKRLSNAISDVKNTHSQWKTNIDELFGEEA